MARRSGGGITSKNLVHKPVKTGQGALKDNVKAVSQIGQAMGNKATDHSRLINPVERLRAGALGAMGSVPLGNQRSAELSGANAGCGKGREVARAGSQGTYGSPSAGSAPAKNTDILNQFGPDSAGLRGRR
jgi:hypothetical protein